MNKKSFTLDELAKLTNSTLFGDPQKIITNVADLESANSNDASFLSNPDFETAPLRFYEKAMQKSQAGVIFISPDIVRNEGRNFLVVDNPSKAFQIVVEAFLGSVASGSNEIASDFEKVHPTAVIHPTASVGKEVSIGPHSVIDKYAVISDRSFIGAGCYIGSESTIGEDCCIQPGVTIRERCRIGNRVILQPGVVIGSCGFGYAPNASGCHIKIKQLGNVVIEDDVEIGANTTVDRARYKETIIGRGTKVDNLVQIGHGAVIGPHNIIVAQTGIAGSSKTGKYVVIGGQAAVAGHISIADKVMIAGRAGVSKSIVEPGSKYAGIPAFPIDEYQRNSVYLRNIKTYIEEIKELKRRIEALEKKERA